MKQMKRLLALLLALLLLTFTACGDKNDSVGTTGTTLSSEVATTTSLDSVEGESTTLTLSETATTTDATTLPVSTATTQPTPTDPSRPSTSAATPMITVTVAGKDYHRYSPYMPDVLRPELRLFAKNCSLAGIGKVVDIYVRNRKVQYCITADGSLYEVADGLFSTTNTCYRKIECEYKLARFLKHDPIWPDSNTLAYLTVDGQKCYKGTVPEGKEKIEKFLLTDEYSAYVGVNNTLVWRENGTDTVVHTFPAGEKVEYVSLENERDVWDGTNEWCTVRTNKGWYLFIKRIEYVDSGYADLPPTEKVTYSVKKITLEKSVEFYWAGYGEDGIGEEGLCIAITKDGTLYYEPSVNIYGDGSIELHK